jgi:hypothetical protein
VLLILLRRTNNSTHMNKTKAAFLFSGQKLSGDWLFFWTFTMAELLSITEVRGRWNRLLTSLRREWPELRGLRVFELHDQHGLHVHVATDRRIDINVVREFALRAGWGRVNVIKRRKGYLWYLAKFLSTKRPGCFRGWRLWAPFGKWNATRVKDVVRDTLFTRTYRAVKEWLGWTGNHGFFDRMRFVRRVVAATIRHSWPDACGPGRQPYRDFDPYDPNCELMRAIRAVPL